MVESKGWNWNVVEDDENCVWKNPSIESYYLLNRWKVKGMTEFLDLGCGLGRHSILFGKNGFNVSAFDISIEAIEKTRAWAENENSKFEYMQGDMLNLPYKDEQFDCILCRNVISHTDTEGLKQVINQIRRVLKKDGECYLTLGSKDSSQFKDNDWPLIDENTKLRMEEGPEYKVPHIYVDYESSKELFKEFKIIDIYQVIDYYEENGKVYDGYHYHLIIKKID